MNKPDRGCIGTDFLYTRSTPITAVDSRQVRTTADAMAAYDTLLSRPKGSASRSESLVTRPT